MLKFPFNAEEILRKRKAIKRELSAQHSLFEKRIAILGGSTTADFKDCLELFLLHEGIKPVFYESEFNKFYEDGAFSNPALDSFKPELVFVFTSSENVSRWPGVKHSPQESEVLMREEVARLRAVWDGLASRFSCPIVQNNFDPPSIRLLGNADFSTHYGRVRFVNRVNEALIAEAQSHGGVYLHDLNYQASRFGLDRWADRAAWHRYKLAFAAEAMPAVALSAANMVKAIFGKSKKCLVLDLDNTLWGGVIGDDGIQGIRVGHETPEAEAHTELQRYAKGLSERGVLLAVCSKNDRANALAGLAHPESTLRESDFAAIEANWEPKPRNIEAIARALNIGIDSLVFLDDNPAERHLVASQLPAVSVPDVGENVERYATQLEQAGYFESLALSEEDLARSRQYQENSQRDHFQAKFSSYDDYLASLEMKAQIAPFSPLYLDRIFQLTNKTNQFNLNTRRYSREEMEALLGDPAQITLYGRLADKFGDNGLISLVHAEIRGDHAEIKLWLMSCRVLKRGMEQAMMDSLVAECRRRGVKRIEGTYVKSAKNGMVEGLLGELGFRTAGPCAWSFEDFSGYQNQNKHIQVETHEHSGAQPGAKRIS
ncbi:MAG: HAD-IIIC family phosphatase [Bdellovibrionota bacterium]